MQTWYYTTVHLEALQASSSSETDVYLAYTFLAAILDLASRWPPLPNKQKQKHNFNTRSGFVALKLVELEVSL